MSDTLPLTLAPEPTPIRHGAAQLDRPERGRPVWHIVAKPHVMILLKRVFPRIQATVTGVVKVTHSPSVAAELTWFMSRYDLRMDPADREFLHSQARLHHEAEESTFRILAGEKNVPGGGFRQMSGEVMRDYQRIAADLISQNRRVLVTDEIGLGKTLTGLATLRNPDALPAVCVVQTHLTGQWQRYVQRVWPELTTHIAKTANPKTDKRKAEPDVLILNYSKLAGWRHHIAAQARTVIFDEVQDLRGGTGTDKGQAAAHIAGEATYVVGLTQTPIYNYGDEMHSVMQIIRPDSLGTREEFIREWCGGSKFGVDNKHSAVKDPKALGEYLRDAGVMIGRTRKEVGRELPYGEPLKIPHPVSADSSVLERMTGNAVEMARLILSAQSDRTERFTTSGELDMMMRQATGIAKAPYVATFVQGLLESQERVVLWGWHHAVYDLWQQQLSRVGIRSVRYSGKDSPRQKALALARFTGDAKAFGITAESIRPGEDIHKARVLIMSLRSGAGVDGLQNHCSVGVFGELDWSPQVHEQCLGRLARDGQENEVLGYYLMAEEGSDPTIAAALGMKHAQSEPMIRPNSGNVTPLPTGGVNGGRVKDLAREILRQAGVDTPE